MLPLVCTRIAVISARVFPYRFGGTGLTLQTPVPA